MSHVPVEDSVLHTHAPCTEHPCTVAFARHQLKEDVTLLGEDAVISLSMCIQHAVLEAAVLHLAGFRGKDLSFPRHDIHHVFRMEIEGFVIGIHADHVLDIQRELRGKITI